MRAPASSVRCRSTSKLRISEKFLILILFATLTSISFGYVIYSSNSDSNYDFQAMKDLPSNMNNHSEQQLVLPNGEDSNATIQGHRNKIREVTYE